MKANSRRTREQKDRDRVDRYITDNYEEVIYDAIALNAANIVRQTVAEFLFAMSMHGYGAKRLHDAFEWFKTVNELPGSIMGRKIDAETVMDTVAKKYEIDFDDINPKYQPYAEYKAERDGSP